MAVETGDSNESIVDGRGNDTIRWSREPLRVFPGCWAHSTGISGRTGTFGFRAFRPQHYGPRSFIEGRYDWVLGPD